MSTVQVAPQHSTPIAAKILLREDTIRCSVAGMSETAARVVVPPHADVPGDFFLETMRDGVRRRVHVATRTVGEDAAELLVEFRGEGFVVWR